MLFLSFINDIFSCAVVVVGAVSGGHETESSTTVADVCSHS